MIQNDDSTMKKSNVHTNTKHFEREVQTIKASALLLTLAIVLNVL